MRDYFKEQAEAMQKEKGYIIVRCYGRDCDGVRFSSATKYDSYEAFIRRNHMDWFDGQVNFEIVDEEEEWSTQGHGWGIV